MTNRTVAISPQVYARIGGVLYLITIVLGAVDELLVRGTIVVPGMQRPPPPTSGPWSLCGA